MNVRDATESKYPSIVFLSIYSAGSKHAKIWSRSSQPITAEFFVKLLYNKLYLINLHDAKIKSRAVTR